MIVVANVLYLLSCVFPMFPFSFSLLRLTPFPFPHFPSTNHTGLNSSATCVANTARGGGLNLGDRVLVVGQRVGTIKFFGTTNFAPGNQSLHSFSLLASHSKLPKV